MEPSYIYFVICDQSLCNVGRGVDYGRGPGHRPDRQSGSRNFNNFPSATSVAVRSRTTEPTWLSAGLAKNGQSSLKNCLQKSLKGRRPNDSARKSGRELCQGFCGKEARGRRDFIQSKSSPTTADQTFAPVPLPKSAIDNLPRCRLIGRSTPDSMDFGVFGCSSRPRRTRAVRPLSAVEIDSLR